MSVAFDNRLRALEAKLEDLTLRVAELQGDLADVQKLLRAITRESTPKGKAA